MYFPYLRGKQFELLALRELSSLMSENNVKISPLIEPIKISTTLLTTISELVSSEVNFSLIVNPTVGDSKNRSEAIIAAIAPHLEGYRNFQIGILIEQDTPYQSIIEILNDFKPYSFTFVHNEIEDNIVSIQEAFNKIAPIVNNVINFKKTSRRYYRNFPAETRVSLEDYFHALPRNADYLKQNESQFSEEHKFFKEDGYKGFSDFLTVGESYSESGFAPYAVAIHISYTDSSGRIKVVHFVSDSNDDYFDPAGKFAEANRKLVAWCDEKELDTLAINEFRHLNEIGHFPGLGTIKKLSIMNHIEVVLNLI